MEQQPDNVEQRLDRLAEAWQSKRYTGPNPDFSPTRGGLPLAWAGAFATAIVLLVLAWPATPQWPDQLRPIVRSSTLEVAAPNASSSSVSFRYPGRPVRSVCFSQSEHCDQPAG